jgi:hypothetical protein
MQGFQKVEEELECIQMIQGTTRKRGLRIVTHMKQLGIPKHNHKHFQYS